MEARGSSSQDSYGHSTSSSRPSEKSWAAYWPSSSFLDCSAIASGTACWSIATPEQTDDDAEAEKEAGSVRLRKTASKMAKPSLDSLASLLPGLQFHDNPGGQVTIGLACAGMLMSIRLASAMGLGRVRPPLVGMLSTLLATGGALSCCLAACAVESSQEVVTLPAGTLACLAWLCGALEVLPLAPLSKAALEGVAGPVRLALPGVVGTVVMFELAHRYWAQIDPADVVELQEAAEGDRAATLSQFQQGKGGMLESVLRLWRSHFVPQAGVSRGVGSAFLGMHLAGTFFSTNVDLAMTQWKKVFFNTLQAKDLVGFQSQLVDFGFIAAVSTLISVYSGYLTMIWDLRWREEVTKDFIGSLVKHRASCNNGLSSIADGGLDNVDQRIAEDTGLFTSHSRSLLCGATESAMRLAVFFPALVQLSPSPHIWQVCLGLSLVTSLLTHVVGQPLASRNAALQRSEADFRTALMRLRLFSEDSEPSDSIRPIEYFETVKAATWLAARSSLNLSAFTSAYGLTSTILPFLILAPSYFSGAITMGTMFQIEGLIGGVQGSLDFFIGAYTEIAAWQAATQRLLTLEVQLRDIPRSLPESAAVVDDLREIECDEDQRLSSEASLAGADGVTPIFSG